ncbi:hypothetical protein FRZ67_04515 [Panacibacter ginsenosidivorans]|uniref:Uncharacterized protein n=1 Tax=Panacibacter ginsenosidivorans TaxID=1813871 RepID=A0A5B8V671_9BACT|nr:hypothetical protein [Panacibacter ginsenosidivorans]QEC66595.1 hypothetical protein FRZ67_04515 [Panacibacter ginsenosidivorans]
MENITETTKAKPKSKTRKRLWEFCNSSLGIWVLSTIFIGLITFSYQNFSQIYKEQTDKNKEIKSLEIEINRRLFIFNSEITEVAKVDTSKKSYPSKIEDAIRKVNSKNCYVFEQFRKRKLSSLLYELYALLPEKNKAVAYEAFEKMFIIEQFPAKINKNTKSDKATGYFDEIVTYTKTSLDIKDWNK